MYQRIIVPVDGSETSNQALAAALGLARECGVAADEVLSDRIGARLPEVSPTGRDAGTPT